MRQETSAGRRDRWHRKALRALRYGNLDAAEAALWRLVEVAPEYADGWFLAGVCALSRRRFALALEHLDRAIALEAGRAAFWAQRAQCLARLGRFEEARVSVDRARALPVADATTHDTLGHLLVWFGRHADAAAQFETAVRQAPPELQFQYNLATALMHCGVLAGARRTYERVLEIDPDQGWAHVALAHTLEGAPPPERRAQLEAALERARGDVDRELLIRQALAHTLEAS
jgi:tetratricopeptide (TPR) repeat protein